MISRLSANVLLLTALLAACSAKPGPHAAAPDLGHGLAAKVTADAMLAHLRALQDIANANGGNRAAGPPGYDASVDHVAKVLRSRGFDVMTPQFDRLSTIAPGKPTLTVAGRSYPVDQASLLVRTPPGGLTGTPVRPTRPAGCTAGDYPAVMPPRSI